MIKMFVHAWNGLVVAFREERNLKIHAFAVVVVIMFGFYFTITITEWLLLLLFTGLVFTLELINTAIENLTDLVTREYHPLAKKAKDIAAAAVLIASIVSVVGGILIFAKYFYSLFIR